MFGYDFMVDTSLNVWLIEVNSSPAMDYSSPITEKMVKDVLPNISDIVVDQEQRFNGKKSADNFVGSKIGKFELIFNEWIDESNDIVIL